MPRVPLVEPPQTAGPSQPAGVRANPGMFDAEAQASSRLGNIVQGIGDQTYDLGMRVKHATDTAYVIGAQTDLEVAHEGLKNKLDGISDTSQWGPIIEDTTKAASDTVLEGGSSLSRNARLQLGTAVANWQKRVQADTGNMRMQQDIRNADGLGLKMVNASIQSGDLEGAKVGISHLVATNVWSTAKGERETERLTSGIVENSLARGMRLDPLGTYNKLTKDEDGTVMTAQGQEIPIKIIGDEKLERMKILAGKALHGWQAKNVDELNSQVDTALDASMPPPNDSEILAQAAAGRISSTAARNVITRIKQTNIHQANDLASLQMAEIVDQDLDQNKEPEKWARDAKDAAAALPDNLRVRVVKAIDAKLNAFKTGESKEGKAVEREIFLNMRDDRYDNGSSIPLIREQGGSRPFHGSLTELHAMKDSEIADTFGPDTPKSLVISNERMAYAKKQEKMRAWFRSQDEAGKHPTLEEANAYRLSLNVPGAMAKVAAAVNPATSTAKAAIAEGTTATNPTTKQKLIFKGGKWTPAQ